MRKLQTLLIILSTVFLAGRVYAYDSNKDRKLNFFFNYGEALPVGDFNDQVKNDPFNLGVGVEYQFPSKWSIGASVHKIEFNHKEIWYDSWNRDWRYTDWTFSTINLYGKYSFTRKSFTPYGRLGLALYSIETKNAWMEKPDDKHPHLFEGRETMVSFIPALGCRYSIKRFFLFMEANYNITYTTNPGGGGDIIVPHTRQFLNFLLGGGITLDI